MGVSNQGIAYLLPRHSASRQFTEPQKSRKSIVWGWWFNKNSTRILLGIGGIRALQALGHDITGLHLNEGHCTFAALEMLHQGWTREQLSQRTLFTTHTPVPAGHDRFSWEEVEQVLGDLLPPDAQEIADSGDTCSMSHLGIGLCGTVNAVSGLSLIHIWRCRRAI